MRAKFFSSIFLLFFNGYKICCGISCFIVLFLILVVCVFFLFISANLVKVIHFTDLFYLFFLKKHLSVSITFPTIFQFSILLISTLYYFLLNICLEFNLLFLQNFLKQKPKQLFELFLLYNDINFPFSIALAAFPTS